LPQKLLSNGGHFYITLTDSIPVIARDPVPQTTGAAEFEVMIECPHAGAFISSISDANAGSIVGSWTCQDHNPNGSISRSSLSFESNGTFASNAPGSFMGGTYEKNGKQLALLINRGPAYPAN